MIGLQTPSAAQASVFGVSSSATSLGFGIGPLSGGLLASAAGVGTALTVAGGVALILAGLIAVAVREPQAPSERRP
jgi:predicted MFS family arabinose efflux permease